MTHPHAHALPTVAQLSAADGAHTRLHLHTAAVSHTSGSGGSILRTVIGLVIVVAVIYGLTWVIRRLKARDGFIGGPGLERVAAVPLGPNASVALVRVGSELHLIGVGEHTVTGIRSYSEDEALELGLPVTLPGSVVAVRDPDAAPAGSFVDTLKRITQR